MTFDLFTVFLIWLPAFGFGWVGCSLWEERKRKKKTKGFEGGDWHHKPYKKGER